MTLFIGSEAECRRAWVAKARCRSADPDELFVRGAAQKRAAVICRHCPVIIECLADALDNQVEFGVWGGMTERQRRALLKRHPEVDSWSEFFVARGTHSANPSCEPAHLARATSAAGCCGAKMHDDLLDAVDYLVAQGIVDRERVAIYGGSYGGYAALVGATFTPEVFKCVISLVGPSNLNTFIESFPEYWKPMIAMWHKRVGADRDFLWSRSPLSRVDDIRIDLIAQDDNDPRVKRAESEQIVAAMEERAIDHEYALYENEGHGLVKPESRLDFYHQADRFLAKHLSGRSQLDDGQA
jgi:dienelactone hydrolase